MPGFVELDRIAFVALRERNFFKTILSAVHSASDQLSKTPTQRQFVGVSLWKFNNFL